MELSFNCTKVNEAVSADKTAWQPHLSSVGTCETDAIAAKVAARTKDDPEVIKSVCAITASEIAKLLGQGLRVVIDGQEDGQEWFAEDFASQTDTEIRIADLSLDERIGVGATGHLKAISPEGESSAVDFTRAED